MSRVLMALLALGSVACYSFAPFPRRCGVTNGLSEQL